METLASSRVRALFEGTALTPVVTPGAVGAASALKLAFATYNKISTVPAAQVYALARHHGVGQTTQTAGMTRLEAISGKTVGASSLWMGQTHVPASTASANHHHGASETAIYVVSGHPAFVFLDVDGEAVVVIARTTQEAIVVNLGDLDWSEVRVAER